MISAFFRRRVAEPDAFKFAAAAQPAAAAPATQPA
jgi:hypothetical protein